MSTPAGRSRRISESTVLGVGSRMSISRLCVRISKCSRESLYLCGERMTQYTFFSVGSGTGPATCAPVRVTVSTIFRAELSMTSWSYALSRMRIFCPAMASLSFAGRGETPTPEVGRVEGRVARDPGLRRTGRGVGLADGRLPDHCLGSGRPAVQSGKYAARRAAHGNRRYLRIFVTRPAP